MEKISNQLKIQVLNLLDDLISICPNEGDVLFVRIYFENQIEPERLMNEFIKWVYPWKKHILDRNEIFFRENDHMFGPLPPEKVKHFKQKFIDGTFDDQDKDTIWDFFEVFISLMDRYKKLQ